MNVPRISLTIVPKTQNVIISLALTNVNVLLVINHLAVNALTLTNVILMYAIHTPHAPTLSEDSNVNVMLVLKVMVCHALTSMNV
jgi:hypothetical protein